MSSIFNSTDEKDLLTDTLNSVLTGEFSDSLFKETLFRLLSRRDGKTFIESLLQAAADASTQTSDSIDNEQMRIRNTHLHIVKLLANTAGNCDFYNNCDGINNNITVYHNKNKTVLHYAARNGWLGIAKSLLKEGADLNAKGYDGDTPIMEATESRQRDIVDLLVDSGADVFCSNSRNETLLHAAAVIGWVGFVRFLLEKGVDPNVADSGGCTPLYAAVLYSKRRTAGLLIDHGADTASRTFHGFPVLHFAAMMSSLEMVRCLVEKGADVDDKRIEGLSPLDVSLRRIDENCMHKIQIIEYLVKKVNLKYGSNELPLKYIMKHHPRMNLIKPFVRRYGYLSKFVDEYYGKDPNLSKKSDIFQNVQACSQAIISKFNDKVLPAFYDLPLPVGTLPPIENLMIASPGIIQDIEESVRHEINTSEHCDLKKPKVIVLRMLAVKSYVNHYNSLKKKAAIEKTPTKRSASAKSGEQSQSHSKVRRFH